MLICEMFLKIVISIYVGVYVVIKFLINKLSPTKILTIRECKIHHIIVIGILQNGIPENQDGQSPSVVARLGRGVAGLSS